MDAQQIAKNTSSEKDQSSLSDQVEEHGQVDALAGQLRQLSQEVILAQEKERQRLARELHDEAGQALTVLKVSLELLQEDLIKAEEFEAPDKSFCHRLGEAICLCEQTMYQIRRLAHNLHPAALEDLGLNLALEGLCSDFSEHTRLRVAYTGSDTPPLADAAQICLYRFLQEGLTNVVKHAQARQVEICLRADAGFVTLAVKDDGRGICQPADASPRTQSDGMGLTGLEERLALLGGRLEIASQPGQGTCLTAFIPFETRK